MNDDELRQAINALLSDDEWVAMQPGDYRYSIDAAMQLPINDNMYWRLNNCTYCQAALYERPENLITFTGHKTSFPLAMCETWLKWRQTNE